MRLKLNCLFGNYKLKLLEQLKSWFAGKAASKNDIKQNTTALMVDSVNVHTAWLIDLLQLNCKYRTFRESVCDCILPGG